MDWLKAPQQLAVRLLPIALARETSSQLECIDIFFVVLYRQPPGDTHVRQRENL